MSTMFHIYHVLGLPPLAGASRKHLAVTMLRYLILILGVFIATKSADVDDIWLEWLMLIVGLAITVGITGYALRLTYQWSHHVDALHESMDALDAHTKPTSKQPDS